MYYHHHTLEDFLLPQTDALPDFYGSEENSLEHIAEEPHPRAAPPDYDTPESASIWMENASEHFTQA